VGKFVVVDVTCGDKINWQLTIVNFQLPIVFMLRPLLLANVLLIASSSAFAADINIAFRVKAPASTPGDAKLYLAGDAQPLGAWKENGVELKKGADGVYAAQVKLPAEQEIQYKVTRGSWGTVEKNADGSEIANRTFRPTKDSTVDVEVAAWADQVGQPKHTATGDIRVHEKFASKNLGNERRLLVWLPPGYETGAPQRYDVLYMHDGQNVFDDWTSFAGEWGADETAAKLIEQKKIRPIIIVAIENNNRRMDEYTMSRDAARNAGGDGAKYARFVAEQVKPFIDKTYRTKPSRENTAIAGSSLGATISLEIARANPDTFGLVAALSPAAWWNDGEMLKRFERDVSWMKGKKFWIDIGTDEGEDAARKQSYVESARRLEALLKKAGLTEGRDYQFKVIEGAQHNEKAWRARFGDALTFLFPASSP
jgi:predicted alpha/beta superfamily hydrolase